MNPTIRPAVPDDAAAIQDVWFTSWQAAYGAYVPAEAFAAFDRPAHVRAIGDRLATGPDAGAGAGTTLVAEVAGDIPAFARVGPCRDDDLRDAGEVYAIYARPAHWSTGLGRTLLPAALDVLANDVIVLWVLEANERARRFYRIAGFEPDGARKVADLLGAVQLPELRYRLGSGAVRVAP